MRQKENNYGSRTHHSSLIIFRGLPTSDIHSEHREPGCSPLREVFKTVQGNFALGLW